MKNKILLLLLLFFCIACGSIGNKQMQNIALTEEFIEGEIFAESIDFYERFLFDNPDDPEFLYKMGFALINTKGREKEAIAYFSKAKKIFNSFGRKGKSIESAFQLARAYRVSVQFDSAQKELEELSDQLKKKPELWEVIQRELARNKAARKLFGKKIEMEITPLGEIVNSYRKDYNPLVSADGNTLVFTSLRSQDENDDNAIYEIEFNEDIFISTKKGGQWTRPQSIGKQINTADDEVAVGLSADGQKLLIRKEDGEGDIYISTLGKDGWSAPKKLNANINTSYRESYACLSVDGNYLYFSSNRPGGFGGSDIYVSRKKENGEWGIARNLGNAINTKFNEESPQIHYNDSTLFFSSKGFNSFGGYDIFYAKKTDYGTWTEAQNIGYPANTTGDDHFFSPCPDGKHAYFTRFKEDDKKDLDLAYIEMKTAPHASLAVVQGEVFVKCKKEIPLVNISLKDEATRKEIIVTPDRQANRFVFAVHPGRNYNLSVQSEGKIIFTEKIFVPFSEAAKTKKLQSIRLDAEVKCK